MEEIRKDLGLCPQHNILYDQLTVKEHLELFGVFKGLKDSELNEKVKKFIHEVDMVSQTDTLA